MNAKTKCTCGAQEVKKRVKLLLLRQGEILLRGSEKYIVAQTSAAMYMLIGLDDGNRWTDGARDLKKLTAIAYKDNFTQPRQEVGV